MPNTEQLIRPALQSKDSAIKKPAKKRGRPIINIGNNEADRRRAQGREAQRRYRNKQEQLIVHFKKESESAINERNILIKRFLGEEEANEYLEQERKFNSEGVHDLNILADLNKTRAKLEFPPLSVLPPKQDSEDIEDNLGNEDKDKVKDKVADSVPHQQLPGTLDPSFSQYHNNLYPPESYSHQSNVLEYPLRGYPTQTHQPVGQATESQAYYPTHRQYVELTQRHEYGLPTQAHQPVGQATEPQTYYQTPGHNEYPDQQPIWYYDDNNPQR